MIPMILKKIMTVIAAAVLILSLAACSAESQVQEMYHAYVAEKDSLIVEHEKEEPEKEEAPASPSVDMSQGTEQELTAGQIQDPGEETDAEETQTAETYAETVVPEVSSEVSAPLSSSSEEESLSGEEISEETENTESDIAAQTEVSVTVSAAADVYEGQAADSLCGAAITLMEGSGSGQVLTLDDGGTLFTLTALETVYDVNIGSLFYGEGAVSHQYVDGFSADVMESGSSVTVRAVIDPDVPDISISWTSADGYAYLKYVSVSAKDNVLMLVAVE